MCRSYSNRNQDCGCGCNGGHRNYLSPEEEVEMLKDYQEQLKKEQAGVDARLNELQDK